VHFIVPLTRSVDAAGIATTPQTDRSEAARAALRVRTGPRKAPQGEPVASSAGRRRRITGDPTGGGITKPRGGAARPDAAEDSPHAELVARPRLADALLDERRASTALICAPAGYGKTTLLKEWTERDPRPAAQITLSDRMGATSVLESIVRALHDIEPVERGLLSRCRAAVEEGEPKAPAPLLRALACTIGAMGTARQPAILALDDAHLARGRGVEQVLSTVIAAAPECAKVALASRATEIVPLGRPRAEGRLLELGGRELALTRSETVGLLGALRLELDADAVDRLVARTEGWPALLYLAARSLRGRALHAGVDQVLQADAAMHAHIDPAITEYITQEALDPLSPEVRDFLERGAVLDRLAARPCDELFGRSDSAAMLDRIASSTLLLTPDDAEHDSWRLHGLVRDVLLADVGARDSRAANRHATKAGKWLEAHGKTHRAIEHAVRFRDAERTGDLLWRHASEFFMCGRDPLVFGWLAEFSENEIARSHSLTLCAALFSLVSLDLPGAERWAQVGSRALDDMSRPSSRVLSGGIALVRAGIARDGVQRMGTLASDARVLLGDTGPWNSFCCLLEGVACHVCGERSKATAELEAGVRLSAARAVTLEALCQVQMAIIDVEEANGARAADRSETALGLIHANALDQEPYATLVFAVSSWVAGQQGRCDEAKRDLMLAVGLLSDLDGLMPWYEAETRLMVARAAAQLADVTMARASLSRASKVLRRLSDAPEFRTWLDTAWAEMDERGAAALSGPASLTMAELRILRFLPTHLTFREIGERLHVSTNTVKTQAHAVYGKLGAASRSEAVAEACALGLIQAAVI